jgi:hypothetical protein
VRTGPLDGDRCGFLGPSNTETASAWPKNSHGYIARSSRGTATSPAGCHPSRHRPRPGKPRCVACHAIDTQRRPPFGLPPRCLPRSHRRVGKILSFVLSVPCGSSPVPAIFFWHRARCNISISVLRVLCGFVLAALIAVPARRHCRGGGRRTQRHGYVLTVAEAPAARRLPSSQCLPSVFS